jgi:dynein intermediate chain 1, axonemal
LVYKGSEEETGAAGQESGGGDVPVDMSAAIQDKKQAPAKNPFNYGQRSSQTPVTGRRERFTNTDPPPSKIFGGSVSQWEIFDAYTEDLAMKERAKERLKQQQQQQQQGKKDNNNSSNNNNESNMGSMAGLAMALSEVVQSGHDDFKSNPEIKRSVSLLERMCNQNIFDDIVMDYKYWEDAADEFREGKGVLLPLWKFSHAASDAATTKKRQQVTAMAWHPSKKDVFVAGIGSYEFKKQSDGALVCFSLKNPSYPEKVLRTECGIMCLEFHPKVL